MNSRRLDSAVIFSTLKPKTTPPPRRRGLLDAVKIWTAAVFLCCAAFASQPAITGQWSFEGGDLLFSAKIGQPMDYLDFAETPFDTQFGTTTDFGIGNINGQVVSVMLFPMTMPGGGFTVPHGAAPTGTELNINQYTIIMDIYYSSASSGTRRALFQTDINAPNNPNAEYFVDAQNRIGTDGGNFSGSLTPDTWHRVAFAVDLTIPSVASFIDGVKVGETSPGSGLDGRFSLNGAYLYFDNDDNNETALGYISSLQFRDERVPDSLITSLGGPTPGGILTGPPPNPY